MKKNDNFFFLKKTLRLLAICLALAGSGQGILKAQFTEVNPTFSNLDLGINFTNGSSSFGDYDRDGDLDILIMGSGEWGKQSKILVNNGGTYSQLNTEYWYDDHSYNWMPDLAYGSVDWGDYDKDGDLDFAISGTNTYDVVQTFIYRNDGDRFNNIGASLASARSISAGVKWLDYDNDGDLDLLVAGSSSDYIPITNLYQNNNGVFTNSGISFEGMSEGGLDCGDYDGDGDIDIIITGRNFNVMTKLYKNNGGNFEVVETNIMNLIWGKVAWGDYDNDGDLDVAIMGMDESYVNRTIVYTNSGSDNFSQAAELFGLSQGSIGWADYDNDGDLDLMVTGINGSTYNTKLYNNNNGTFTDIGFAFANLCYSYFSWGDIDNDGDLDLLLSGQTGWHVSTRLTKLYRNTATTPNQVPGVPGNLHAVENGTEITLFWDQATDAETPQAGLSYNIYVLEEGSSANATPTEAFNYSEALNGHRLVASWGKVKWNPNGYTLKLQNSKHYKFSVQSVDAGFAGSAFAEEYTGIATPFTQSGSGSWTDPAIWGGTVPNPGDEVVIGAGLTITIPASKETVECADLTIAPLANLSVEGTLNVNGNLLIESDATGTGSLIDKGTVNVSGTKNMELYLAQNDRYYYVSTPVAGATAAVFGNVAGADKLYWRNTAASAWEQISNPDEVLIVGQGYTTKQENAAQTIAFQGNLNTGAKTINLEHSGDYWNLVGNPYASPMDWGTENSAVAGWSNANIRNTIYVKAGGNFAIWNAALDGEAINGGSRYIPAMQAFWVKSIAPGSKVEMNNNVRVHNGNHLMKQGETLCQKIRVKVSRDNYTDEAVLRFHNEALTDMDKLDAEKRFASDAQYPQVFMSCENEKLAIQSLPQFAGVNVQALGFKTAVAGTFTFGFSQMESFGAAATVYLEDKLVNKMTDLNQNPVYTFESGICDNQNRFVIHIADGTSHYDPFDEPGTTDIESVKTNMKIYSHQNSIIIKSDKAINATVMVYNLLGAELRSVQLNGDFARIELAAQGQYIVKVMGSEISSVEKVCIK